MKEKFYFFTDSMATGQTTLERRIFMRAQLFERHLHVSPMIVTLGYEPRFAKNRADFIERQLLSENTVILNMYEDLQMTQTTLLPPKKWHTNPLWSYEQIPDTYDVGVLNSEGRPVQYRYFDDEDHLETIVYYDTAGVILRTDLFDANGYLSKSQIVKEEAIVCEIFYRTDGKVCMYHFFENDELTLIQLVDDEGAVLHQCDNEVELATFWLKTILEDDELNLCFVDEDQVFAPIFEELGRKIKLVGMVHSAHVDFPHRPIDGPLNEMYRRLFQQREKFSAVVFESFEQYEHVQERFGNRPNHFVIPTGLLQSPNRTPFEERSNHHLLFQAPLETNYQPDIALRIFSKVAEHVPDAFLTFCGQGPMQFMLQQLAIEKGLEERVFFIEQPTEELYADVQLALSTSIEGEMPISILDGLAHGIPTASFTYLYGPGDLIMHHISGLLATVNDEEALADSIIHALTDESQLEDMSNCAYEEAERFQAKNYAIYWTQLIQRLREDYWKK